jgi:hypothetical protein
MLAGTTSGALKAIGTSNAVPPAVLAAIVVLGVALIGCLAVISLKHRSDQSLSAERKPRPTPAADPFLGWVKRKVSIADVPSFRLVHKDTPVSPLGDDTESVTLATYAPASIEPSSESSEPDSSALASEANPLVASADGVASIPLLNGSTDKGLPQGFSSDLSL